MVDFGLEPAPSPQTREQKKSPSGAEPEGRKCFWCLETSRPAGRRNDDNNDEHQGEAEAGSERGCGGEVHEATGKKRRGGADVKPAE